MEGKVGSEVKPGSWPEWACFQEQGLGRVVQGRERNTAAFLLCSLPGMRTLGFPILTLPSLLTTHGLLALLTQNQFGRTGSRCPGEFCLFQSKTKNLLFNDNTECLAKLHGKTTYDKYLGQEYVVATANLKQCSSSREWILDRITEESTWQNVAGFLLGHQTAPRS